MAMRPTGAKPTSRMTLATADLATQFASPSDRVYMELVLRVRDPARGRKEAGRSHFQIPKLRHHDGNSLATIGGPEPHAQKRRRHEERSLHQSAASLCLRDVAFPELFRKSAATRFILQKNKEVIYKEFISVHK
jgi:hypothetical protein